MAWSLAGVTIHPGDRGYTREKSSNYSIQQVLDTDEEVVGFYGSNSRRTSLIFFIFGDEEPTGMDELEAALDADSNAALVGNLGSIGNFRILTLRGVRRQDLSRPAYECWECAASLIKV